MSDYASNTVPQLKELLKARGLPVDGKKADLVARLTENDSAPKEAEPVPEAEPAKEAEPVPETASETKLEAAPVEESKEKPKEKEPPKVLTPEERKKLAVDLLTKKIQRAEKFGDEASAEASKKDLARVEKFGVEPGTALAKEIGLVDKSLNKGLSTHLFKKHRRGNKKHFKPNFHRRR